MSEYLTAAEAAELVGCSGTHIRDLIQDGNLEAIKKQRRWHILREDVEVLMSRGEGMSERTKERGSEGAGERTNEPIVHRASEKANEGTNAPANERTNTLWRADLLAQVARLEASEDRLRADVDASARREELSKVRIIDLERELTVRDSLRVDLQAKQEAEVTDLREQVAVLEAKVREVLEERAEENGQLANRIADLVAAHTEMQSRVVELQPVAEQVPMLQAAVEEKDAALTERDATLTDREQALSDRERELGDMRADIETIASRPVTGPVFRLLTRGKLRR
jgi:excisionase family DNA binding protein